MGQRVTLDRDVCLSSGRCVADHPTGFEFDEDEIARTTDGADALPTDALLDAARNCPSGAIQVLDENGQELDPW